MHPALQEWWLSLHCDVDQDPNPPGWLHRAPRSLTVSPQLRADFETTWLSAEIEQSEEVGSNER